ncbi:MAG: alanine racemase [Planctomycetota bacterium]
MHHPHTPAQESAQVSARVAQGAAGSSTPVARPLAARPLAAWPLAAWPLAAWPLDAATVAALPSPSLVIWMQHVRENVDRVLRLAQGRWRPHIKTVKIPEVLAVLIARGVRTFKCATPLEAQVMAALLEDLAPGEGDLLVAFPHVGPNLRRLGELARALPGVRWSIASEDPEHAASVPRELGVFIDVNSGMDRTGAPLGDEARIRATAKAAGARLRGLHAYDGHHLAADPATRAAAVRDSNGRIRGLVDHLRADGFAIDEVVTAGTPAFPAALADEGWLGRPEHHRVSPGTVVLSDLRCDAQVPELGLVPAALVLGRVVSRPTASRVTCDVGSKALSADVDVVGRPLGWPGLHPQRPSEEHLPLEVAADSARPALGEALWFVPGHVCPTVNLYDEALLVEEDGSVSRARVAARGHD